MENVLKYKENFIKECSPLILKSIDLDLKIYGVSIAPISKKGKTKYLTLGRETGGKFKRQFNFFGGTLADKLNGPFLEMTKKERADGICGALFEEVFEEFCILLTPKLFKQCLQGVIMCDYKDGYSLVFPLHIKNIPIDFWNQMMAERRKMKFDHHLTEISDILTFDIINDLNKYSISFYVENCLSQIKKFYLGLNNKESVDFFDFKNTDGMILY
jgi:hypothetical protein